MLPAFKQKSPFEDIWGKVVDAVLPPRCIATGEVVDAQGAISAKFWPDLQFIDAPFCKTCGMPFPFDMAGEGAICAACMENEPAFHAARSAVIYNDASRKLILSFKYGDRLDAVHTFVPWMIRAGGSFLEEADVIIPVPLHPKRLRERRFNQSAVLAEEIAKRTQKTYAPDLLKRIKSTVPQKGLSRKQRLNNVKNAFGIEEKNIRFVERKRIVLIDDVFTSGATLNAGAEKLLSKGADRVSCLTIARVLKDELTLP